MAKLAQAPWAGWQNTWMRNEQFSKEHREKMCLLAEDLRMNSQVTCFQFFRFTIWRMVLLVTP